MKENAILSEFQGFEMLIIDYHNNYNNLISVWFKFKELNFENPQHCIIHSGYKSEIGLSLITDKEILKPYLKLVEAIEWYNSTLK